jgi:hypothetical protein
MRSALLLCTLAACSPDIVPGSYLCGPERLCPDDQVCDGVTNICVLPNQAMPFACPPQSTMSEIEPNDSGTSAQQISNLACVSRSAELVGCAKDLDGEDWFQFDTPSDCTAVGVTARLTFPLAFEVLALDLRDANGAIIATGEQCPQSEPDDGDEQRCVEKTLTPGGHYAVRVSRTGESTCDGACAHNRYTLTLALETP